MTHLGLTLDYLVKDGEYKQVDKDTFKKLKDIQKLSIENINSVIALLDAFIKQTKLQGIWKQKSHSLSGFFVS